MERDRPSRRPGFSGRLSPWRTTLVYAGGASAWIVFSDRLVELTGFPALHTYKGLAFILLSAVALFAWLRHKTQQQLRYEHLLAAAAERKTRLLAAVSHDLRQPLQSLALFTAVIAGDAGLAPRSATAAERLKDSVERMGQLLNAILELARFDVGMVKGKLQPVPLDPLLASLVEEMGPQAEIKGLALRHVPTSLVVESDPVLLLTILRNFVANAIRYTDAGRVVIGCRRRGRECVVGVYDTGRGIAEDQLELVFEEFYQIGNPERDSRLGLGLGLAVVDRLSRLLGHRVLVRSTPGRGSAFCLAVPEATAVPADRLPPSFPRKREAMRP